MEPVPQPDPPPASCGAPAACALLAWQRRRLVQLEQLAASDALTGLWNRAHFERMMEAELARSQRLRQPVSLVLFDVDHFKRINDALGHAAGDRVLRELALVANASIRAADLLFRWGGEEFAVLAAGTGRRGAARLAESLRHRIATHVFPDVGTLTVSLGVAEHVEPESAGEWFGRADAMLYAAKRAGRNTVRVDARSGPDPGQAAGGRAGLHLVWHEDYECGEERLDGEHRRLFDLANDLIGACLAEGENAADRLPACDRLLAHVALHFEHEEALLARLGYEGLRHHRRLHKDLLARGHELRAAVRGERARLGEVVEFLAREVVARHLLRADRDFFPLLASGR